MVTAGGGQGTRLLAALARQLDDAYGFQGLRLETETGDGRRVAYRVLPAPFGGPADLFRVVQLGPGGKPLPAGARRATRAEVLTLLERTLSEAASGWAASATRTAGVEASFGPKGVKLAFRHPSAVAARIPLEEPAAPAAPAPLARPERAAAEFAAHLASGTPCTSGAPCASGTPCTSGVPCASEAPATTGMSQAVPGPAGAAADPLPPDQAAPLLTTLGLASPSGQVRRDERRKYNQIVHFLRLLEVVARRLPAGREVLVVDCGCGKSQLLFVLNYWLTERLGRRAFFVGLDTDPRAVTTARRLQEALGYRNMAFEETSIRDWRPPAPPDLVLSLHACDTATDEAIALGVRSRSAGVVVVPCCQHELAPQVRHETLAPVLRHPILLDRFGDWLTDGLRALALEACGWQVDVLEYVSPLDTPKNIMLRAVRVGGPDLQAYEAYCAIKEVFKVRPALDELLRGYWPRESGS
ncbi:MAG: SAM-dependent methyltransferase [Firmicutes bacterium]|nr:SAM-dependent methyltransferase [Bacillota bacterium]